MKGAAAALLAVAVGLTWPAMAMAAVERFAVIIGNDVGDVSDRPLLYAESDAGKVASTLEEIGGHEPVDIVLLRGRDVDSVRRALIAMNDRIRSRIRAGVQAMLLVYYSGHGDSRSLHLGRSRFPLDELEQLVRGSSATFRLLIVDSCRSGALTRVKGGTPAAPLPIAVESQLAGEGVAFLTSSSSSEDAQESDELRGSFFTHYFVSGLAGAADSNQDGLVGLREAYRYAYEATVRESSRTAAGVQHPTFRFELGGQGDVWLTRIQAGGRRAILRFPPGMSYLVFARGSSGPVVVEVGGGDRPRAVSVAPGRYHVRGRGQTHLVEGAVQVAAGQELAVDVDSLDRVEYARLVRKGVGLLDAAHGLSIGWQTRTAVAEGTGLCHGGVAGYSIDLALLSLGARLGLCRSSFANDVLTAHTTEIELGVRAAHARDWRHFTADIGVGAGATLARDSFETRGRAPTRWSGFGYLELSGSLARDVARRTFVVLEAGGRAYSLSVEGGSREPWQTFRLAVRAGAAVGLRF